MKLIQLILILNSHQDQLGLMNRKGHLRLTMETNFKIFRFRMTKNNEKKYSKNYTELILFIHSLSYLFSKIFALCVESANVIKFEI